MKHIVIVGGSHAGVGTAHKILKQAAKTKTAPFKVTLVSRDSHFYWNIAVTRGIIPGQYTEDQLFREIAPGFAHYPAGKFEFVLASATGLDVGQKKLEVTDGSGAKRDIAYDYLILATGSHTKGDTPLKSQGSTDATKKSLKELQEKIKAAKAYAVVGAGATGCEVAAELAEEYKSDKQVILISNGASVLPGRPQNFTKVVHQQLQALKVDIRLNARVVGRDSLPDGRQELSLSDGTKVVVDLEIPTFGVLPNSGYIPMKFLDDSGFVQVDDYQKIKGAKDVYALGDISNNEPPQFIFTMNQVAHMAKNILLLLKGKDLVAYKPSTKPMMGLQIGKKSGAGHMGNMRLPGFLVARVRKTLFIENFPKTVDGSMA